MGAREYRELDVWRLADRIRRGVWVLTEDASFDRCPWLRDQMRRAAHSACANIAEGFARFQPKDFARFLEIARASLTELAEHLAAPWIEPARCREAAEIAAAAARARKALTVLIRYLRSCTPPTPGRDSTRHPSARRRTRNLDQN